MGALAVSRRQRAVCTSMQNRSIYMRCRTAPYGTMRFTAEMSCICTLFAPYFVFGGGMNPGAGNSVRPQFLNTASNMTAYRFSVQRRSQFCFPFKK